MDIVVYCESQKGGSALPHHEPLPQENTVILFIEKTWFLWWMLAIFLALRWFHVLSAAAKKMEGPYALALEEEQAYIVSRRILRKAHAISIFQTKRAH
jgi:hypothetical protein